MRQNNFHLLCSSDEDEDNNEDRPPQHAEKETTSAREIASAIRIQAVVRMHICRCEFARVRHQIELEIAARLQIDHADFDPENAEEEDTVSSIIQDGGGRLFESEEFLIEMGEEKPVFAASKAYVFNSQNFSQIRFFGRCFLCAYAGHSQRYCALKYCANCDTFGHSVVCCGRQQHFQIQHHYQRQSLRRFKKATSGFATPSRSTSV